MKTYIWFFLVTKPKCTNTVMVNYWHFWWKGRVRYNKRILFFYPNLCPPPTLTSTYRTYPTLKIKQRLQLHLQNSKWKLSNVTLQGYYPHKMPLSKPSLGRKGTTVITILEQSAPNKMSQSEMICLAMPSWWDGRLQWGEYCRSQRRLYF